MLNTSQSILPRPARRQRASFVLTSLIDIIFLLVIFFMVTSQITPFSLLPLTPLAGEAGEAPAAQTPPGAPISVRILAGRVSIGGRSVPMGEIGKALSGLKSRGVSAILLTPGATATVQDVVTVLEAAKDAEIANVTVLSRRGARP
jgi:biopolymer transport protein ExbD